MCSDNGIWEPNQSSFCKATPCPVFGKENVTSATDVVCKMSVSLKREGNQDFKIP